MAPLRVQKSDMARGNVYSLSEGTILTSETKNWLRN